MLAVVAHERPQLSFVGECYWHKNWRLTISVDNTVDKSLCTRLTLRCNHSDDNLPLSWALRTGSHRPQNVGARQSVYGIRHISPAIVLSQKYIRGPSSLIFF